AGRRRRTVSRTDELLLLLLLTTGSHGRATVSDAGQVVLGSVVETVAHQLGASFDGRHCLFGDAIVACDSGTSLVLLQPTDDVQSLLVGQMGAFLKLQIARLLQRVIDTRRR